MATRVSLTTLGDGSLAVTKTPLTGDRRDRGAEGHWLQRANDLLAVGSEPDEPATDRPQRAGVVPLIGIESTAGRPATAATIVTGRVSGETLRTTWLAPTGVASALALVADLLADLHTHGLVHGNLSVDHIILDPRGPRLCSPHGSITDPLVDAVAMGHCVRSMLERWDRLDVPVPRRDDWERLADGIDDTSLPLRRLARTLERLAAPTKATPIGDAAPRRPWGFVVAGALAITSLAGLLVVADLRPAGTALDTTELVIDGHRYRLSAPNGPATVIAEACDHQPSVVVLDPDTDRIWQFDAGHPTAAPGRPTTGTILAEVPGAQQLAIEDGEPCPTVWAIGPAGRTLVIGNE